MKGNGKMKSPGDHLEDLANHVHGTLRLLRMGDKGKISCGEFTMDEVRNYTFAYAVHKKKWFNMVPDSVSNSLIVERAEKPVRKPKEKEEEVE